MPTARELMDEAYRLRTGETRKRRADRLRAERSLKERCPYLYQKGILKPIQPK
jgi:hypothetical protein